MRATLKENTRNLWLTLSTEVGNVQKELAGLLGIRQSQLVVVVKQMLRLAKGCEVIM